MIYKFSNFLNLHYEELENFIAVNEQLSKEQILERCTGEISYELLQSLKELVFDKIGKTAVNEIYIA